MSGTFTTLLVVEVLITAVAIAMFLYRGLLDMKEDDHLQLDDAEAHLQREQAVIRQKVNIVSRYIKVVGVAWCVLAVVLLGVLVVEGLNLV
jgi:hypothetical protein